MGVWTRTLAGVAWAAAAPSWAQEAPAGSTAAPAAAAAPVAASGPSVQDLTFVQTRQVWGWTGIGMVGGGLVLGVAGAAVAFGGVAGAVGGGIEGDPDALGDGAKAVVGGGLMVVGGFATAAAGVPLASAAAAHGAVRAKQAGVPVSTTAGWVSVGALGGYLALGVLPDETSGTGKAREATPGRVESLGRPVLLLTSIGASAGQLVQTRAALRTAGYAAASPRGGRPGVQVALVPAGRGVALAGSF
jgi:hypothetical protein